MCHLYLMWFCFDQGNTHYSRRGICLTFDICDTHWHWEELGPRSVTSQQTLLSYIVCDLLSGRVKPRKPSLKAILGFLERWLEFFFFTIILRRWILLFNLPDIYLALASVLLSAHVVFVLWVGCCLTSSNSLFMVFVSMGESKVDHAQGNEAAPASSTSGDVCVVQDVFCVLEGSRHEQKSSSRPSLEI